MQRGDLRTAQESNGQAALLCLAGLREGAIDTIGRGLKREREREREREGGRERERKSVCVCEREREIHWDHRKRALD